MRTIFWTLVIKICIGTITIIICKTHTHTLYKETVCVNIVIYFHIFILLLYSNKYQSYGDSGASNILDLISNRSFEDEISCNLNGVAEQIQTLTEQIPLANYALRNYKTHKDYIAEVLKNLFFHIIISFHMLVGLALHRFCGLVLALSPFLDYIIPHLPLYVNEHFVNSKLFFR